MNCETFRKIASARQDGEASAEELATLERHLADCRGCAGWVTELKADRQRLLDWPEERPQRPLRLPASRLSWRTLAAAAAVAIVFLAIGFVAGRTTSTADMTDPWPPSARHIAFVEQQRTVYPARNEIHSEILLDPASRRTP